MSAKRHGISKSGYGRAATSRVRDRAGAPDTRREVVGCATPPGKAIAKPNSESGVAATIDE